MNKFYVYIYFRPWDGSPCYVGKGQGFRWSEHRRLGINHYNKHFAAIFAKALQLGLDMPCVKIRMNLTDEEAIAIEIAFIKAIGRADKGLGPLVNWTDGGDGSTGYNHSEEARKRIAKAMSKRIVGEVTREKLRQANLGKIGTKKSVEFKQMISRVHKGRQKSLEERQNISKGKTGGKLSEETKAAIGASHLRNFAIRTSTNFSSGVLSFGT